jgi:uncharacterized membrane protein YeaQ/YmgE (transglycosylase-associated protein family)
MSIVAWLVVGVIAGWMAGLVVRGGGFGLIGDVITGVLGALFGGWLATQLFGGDYITGINVTTILVAFVGALILIAIERAIFGRRGRL